MLRLGVAVLYVPLATLGVCLLPCVLAILGYFYLPQILFLMNQARLENAASHGHEDDIESKAWSRRPRLRSVPGGWFPRGVVIVVCELWKDLVLGISFFYIKSQLRSKAGIEWSTADYFQDRFLATPDREAIVTESETLTFRQLEERSNAVARWAQQSAGLRQGDVCAILMETGPDFVIAWLGLAKVGCVAGLINTNLSHGQLGHAVQLALKDTLGKKVLVVSQSLLEKVRELEGEALKG